MNHRRILPLLTVVFFGVVALVACRKVNEATTLGSGLIPPIDNITTFETFLDIESDNKVFTDTTKVYYDDLMALGHISNDPEFGATHANAYFSVSRQAYYSNPFTHKDSTIIIDSVVLSLSVEALYGDTNTTQTVRVFEVAQNSGFNDTTLFRYNQPDFTTVGAELGSKTYQLNKLDDSILHIRKRDTTRLANVIRIPITNALGTRFAQYDTANTANGGFRTDSIFKTLFRGLAIRSDNAGNGLAYTSPSNFEKTKLTVYFRKTISGVVDTTSADFFHLTGGQANIVKHTPGGNWASYLANATPNDDLAYLQSAPGSYLQLKIPGLDTLPNSVIHRAEIILTPVPSVQDNIFRYPVGLFLDNLNAAGDTAYTFDKDMELSVSASAFNYNFGLFGGLIKSDSTFRFNISRYVQDIVTNDKPNNLLRLYSPVRAFVYSPSAKLSNQIYVNDKVAYGRVVLAGGAYAANPARRMRMRVVYSRL